MNIKCRNPDYWDFGMYTMNLDVEDDKKEEIGKAITNPDSPVGIDAKKTHIIIINKLIEIEKRLENLEKRTKNF